MTFPDGLIAAASGAAGVALPALLRARRDRRRWVALMTLLRQAREQLGEGAIARMELAGELEEARAEIDRLRHEITLLRSVRRVTA